jgi:hypothetical protein
MNRLKFLKQTIFQNLSDNMGSPHEFVLLDYNSTDGTGDWVQENLMGFIESGVLTYYREGTAQYWRPSHSRNMCFRLGAGDILCNLDVDNFTGEGFATYLIDVFTRKYDEPKVIANHPNIFECKEEGGHGRIAMSRRDFYYYGGYDEEFIGWGEEDNDLNLRCMSMEGVFHRVKIHWRFLKYIKHSNFLRVKHVDFSDLDDPSKNPEENKPITRKINRTKSKRDTRNGLYVKNFNKNWGGGTVTKNFTEEIELKSPWIGMI